MAKLSMLLRRSLLAGLLLLILVPSFAETAASPAPAPAQAAVPDLSTREEQRLLRSIATAVTQRDPDRLAMPASFTADTQPRMVFLSLSDGHAAAQVVTGTGNGVGDAIRHGVSQATRLPQPPHPVWIKLDIAISSRQFTLTDANSALPILPGIEGILFTSPQGVVPFLPEEVMADGILTDKRKLDANHLKAAVHAHLAPQGEITGRLSAEMFFFTTRSYFTDGKQVITLYRGHQLYSTVTRGDLLESARLGGEYLCRVLGNDGRFNYQYRPDSNTFANDYNILRHAGSVYSMLKVYAVTKDPTLLAAAKLAINYMVATAKPFQNGTEVTQALVEDDEAKLGGNALAILALEQYTRVTKDRQYVPFMIQLGRWMEAHQSPDGDFVAKEMYTDGKHSSFNSLYYPGEAIFALMRLYAIDPQQHWVDSAEKGVDYLMNVRDKEVADADLIHDHWLLYGLNELYRVRPTTAHLQYGMRFVRVIIASQQVAVPYRDWEGCYAGSPRATPAATRTEGLCAAYQMACTAKLPRSEREQILTTIKRSICFQLGLQYRPESVMYFPDPARAIGGVRGDAMFDESIRIDFVQHNLCSILALYHIMQPSRPWWKIW